jgi:hypothetical protein
MADFPDRVPTKQDGLSTDEDHGDYQQMKIMNRKLSVQD